MLWLTRRELESIHAGQIAEHGGEAGIRDGLLLESALARPRNLYEYEDADVFHLAAAYAFGICKNHPFIDGNKRTALMSAYSFLQVNGFELDASEPEAAGTILRLAEGQLSEAELAEWLQANSISIS